MSNSFEFAITKQLSQRLPDSSVVQRSNPYFHIHGCTVYRDDQLRYHTGRDGETDVV